MTAEQRPAPADVVEAISTAHLSRRQFLASAAAVSLGSSLTAVGSAAASPARAAQIAAVSKSVLRFGMNTTIPGLDPQKWWNGAAACGQAAVFDTLLVEDPYTQKLIPWLAASLPLVENHGLRYTFKLRSGVKFSNGMPLTSADVKYSFERLVIPSIAAQAGSLFTPLAITGMADVLNQKSKTLKGVTTPDPHTVVFNFDAPDSAFIYLIALIMSGVVPKALVEHLGEAKFNWAPVGSGPFTANVVNRSSLITLTRNPKYWQPGIPSYAGVNWQMGVDDTLSMIRIQGGQQDMMYDPVPAGSVAAVLGNPTYVTNHQAVKTPQNNCYWLSLNQKDPLLSKLLVRQAIAMAVNKPRILQAMHALGQVANGGFFSPLSPFYQDGLAYQYNPAKAKALLAQAGVKSGATIKMYSSNRFPYAAVGQVIQADLAAIGLNIHYTQMQYDAFVTLTSNSPAGIVLWAYELLYPHGSYIIDSAFTTAAKKSCCNYAWYSSPTLDKLALQGHRATTPAAVASVYKQIQKIIVKDEAAWVPLVYPTRLDFVGPKVRNFQAAVSLGEDQHRLFYKYGLA
jgi:oligopeptide transport system substrate-binding protein